MNEHKELLEAAAKAAGMKFAGMANDFGVTEGNRLAFVYENDHGGHAICDCLTNDRYDLARRCKLTIHFETGEVIPPEIDGCYTRYEFDIGDDLEEALAILRAAAATGETK